MGKRVAASPRPCSGRRVAAAKRQRVDASANCVRKLQRREIGTSGNRAFNITNSQEKFRNFQLQVGYALFVVPQKPAWLEALLTDQFFTPCSIHLEHKKNEVNIFCVDCSASICQHCLYSHRSHRLLQVRRYVYHDVIRLQNMQNIDCSLGQTYITNSARVVFLNQRPQSRLSKGLGNSCETCDRVLQKPYRYFSVLFKLRKLFRSIDIMEGMTSKLHLLKPN